MKNYHNQRVPGMLLEGVSPVYQRLEDCKFPKSLEGKRVLDVGAWDGFFSFEAERRGASQVVAVDTLSWDNHDDVFDAVHTQLNSKVVKRRLSVTDFDSADIGMFDVVLFLQVLYHMEHPLLALQKVRSVCRDFMLLETMTQGEGFTLTGHEHVGTIVHWPSRKWLEIAMSTVGFRYECVFNYDVERCYEGGEATRTVYHAWVK